jgi:hypothetical protein
MQPYDENELIGMVRAFVSGNFPGFPFNGCLDFFEGYASFFLQFGVLAQIPSVPFHNLIVHTTTDNVHFIDSYPMDTLTDSGANPL